jgi:NitT/TauT family transport system substrate-binding protein
MEENRMSGLISLLGRCATACIVVSALAAPALSADPVKLRVSTIPIIDSAPFEAARVQGYFTAENLQVDATPVVGGAAGLPALAAGQVQIAASNTISIILGVKNNLPFKIIAAGDTTLSTPPDFAGLVAKPGSGLKTGKDFEGKSIAVNTRNNIIWLYAREWVSATGGNPDKVNYVEVPFPQMIDAVTQGRVDGAFVVEPFFSSGIQPKIVELVGWPYATVQKSIPIMQWAASDAFVQANPDVIERFVRAYNKGTDWVNQNKGSPAWIELISGYTRIPADKVKEISVPAFVKVVEPAKLAEIAELMKKHKILSSEDKVDLVKILHKSVLSGAK